MGHHGVWSHSLTNKNRLDALVSRELLCKGDYLLLCLEEVLDLPAGFVVLLIHFHKRSLRCLPTQDPIASPEP